MSWPASVPHRELTHLVDGYDASFEEHGRPELRGLTFHLDHHYPIAEHASSPADFRADMEYDSDEDADQDEAYNHDLQHAMRHRQHEVPPLVVLRHDGGDALLDGNHRAGLGGDAGVTHHPAYVGDVRTRHTAASLGKDPDFATKGPGAEWRAGLPEHHEQMVQRWESDPRDVGTGKARTDFRKLLSTAPPIEGPVYRGDTPPKTYGYRSEIEKKVQPGKVINIGRWSSTSTRPEVAAGFGRVVYEIHGHNARGIGNTLHEGVMPPGKFQVHSAEWDEEHPSRAVIDGRTMHTSPTLRVVLHPHEEKTAGYGSEMLDQLHRKTWDKVRAEHQSVHRGFGMELSDEDHAIVHDASRPTHERAAHLMKVVAHGERDWRSPGSGLGTHWSTDENVAHHFAKTDARERQKYDWQADGEAHGYDGDFERQRPETRVVMHAHFPEHEHIAHDEVDQDGGVFGYDQRNDLHPVNGGGAEYEREVPIKRRQPVKVHAISWGLTSHMSESEAPHDRETTRYDFPEVQHHTAVLTIAAREPGSVDCWVCGGRGMDDAEGMECGACDGSGYLTPSEQREPGVRCPCGEKVRKDTSGDLTHLDGSVSHDDGVSVAEKMRGQRTAARQGPKRDHRNSGVPFKRIFGPTHGLDLRLFDDDHLKPEVRDDIIGHFAGFCDRHGYVGWRTWAKLYFFGSEASEWTSKDRIGNNDFDLSLGVLYDRFREVNPRYATMPDLEIANMFTEQMHAELNDPEKIFEVAG